MKIVAIGDTHGNAGYWKQIVEKETFDKLVFIGDYFDSFHIAPEDQLNNFLDICEYKRQNPDVIVLLRGNHDEQYSEAFMNFGEVYSGFNRKHALTFMHALEANKDIMQMAYEWNDHLFTHAGVTGTWLDWATEKCGLTYETYPDIASLINDIWKYKPSAFCFQGYDPYGDDPRNGPIWVRPQSLNEDAVPRVHVVGHTRQKQIGIEPTGLVSGGQAFFIDTLEGDQPQYLVIEQEGKTVKYTVKDLVKVQKQTPWQKTKPWNDV